MGLFANLVGAVTGVYGDEPELLVVVAIAAFIFGTIEGGITYVFSCAFQKLKLWVDDSA